MRQARPLVRAELILVRNICELDVEHFRRINQDVEAEFKEVAKTACRRLAARPSARRGNRFTFRPSQILDGLSPLHESGFPRS